MQQDNYRRVPARRTQTGKRRRKQRRFAVIVILLVSVLILFAIAAIVSKQIEKSAAAGAALPQSDAMPAFQPEPEPAAPETALPAIPPVTDAFGVEGLPPLFNYQHAIPGGYQLDLVDAGAGQTMQRGAAAAFMAMSAAAADDGVTLVPISGYRSHEHQQNNYDASIQNYLNQGIAEAEAIRLTQLYYAVPGTSEHEAGLAMDIGVIDDSFADTPAYTWLQTHCTEFGFINRYRQDQTAITHISWEPWHYRFVGTNHAALIEDNGLTLEEYLEQYEAVDGSVSTAGSGAPNP